MPMIALLVPIGYVVASGVALWWVWALVRKIRGKEIFVIGAEAVGKSSLISFLGGRVDIGSTTDQSREYQSFVIGRGEKKIYIKKGRDVSGLEDEYKVWKRRFLSADFVFYLINVHKAQFESSDDYARRLYIDATRINRWFEEAPKLRKLIVVGTHRDKLPSDQRSRDTPGCLDEFRMRVGRNSERVEIVFGSLKNHTEAKKLVREICGCLLDEN